MILALLLALGASPLSVSGPRSNTVARCGSTATPIASLTCETGEVLTYTDATTGTSCPNPNEDTNYTIPAINTPCFTAGYGIALHSAVTNNTVRSEAFDNAAWIDVAVAVTRVAGAADSPLNGADSDTLADSMQAVVGATQDGLKQQYSASTSGRQVVSVWVEVAAGTLNFSLCAKSGTDTCNTGNGCCQNGTATTTWQRASLNTTFGATAQTGTIVIVIGNDGVATAGTLIVFGAQAETTTATSGTAPYCPSTGATATTCAAAILTAPTSIWNYVHGAVDMTFRPYWRRPDVTAGTATGIIEADGADTTHNVRRVGVANDSKVYVRNYDGASALTETNSAASAWVVGTAKTVSFAWGDASRTVLFNGVKSTMSAVNDTNMPAAQPTTVRLGGASGGGLNTISGYLMRVVVYRVPPGLYR